MSEFPYLGSSIAANGRIDDEINRRKTFSALCQDVLDANLSITTKRLVCYQFCSMVERVGFL